MTDRFETHEHDVLIIGAGGAGLRAAIEALAKGAKHGDVVITIGAGDITKTGGELLQRLGAQ